MMPFKSVEDFFEECTTGVEFRYDGKWYLIEFDDPFTGLGVVRIHRQGIRFTQRKDLRLHPFASK